MMVSLAHVALVDAPLAASSLRRLCLDRTTRRGRCGIGANGASPDIVRHGPRARAARRDVIVVRPARLLSHISRQSLGAPCDPAAARRPLSRR